MTNEDKPGELPLFLTVDECAKILNVNRKTIYDAIKDRRSANQDCAWLSGVRKIGGTYRILRSAVLGSASQGQGCDSLTG